jgi:hypothetical protein
MNALSELSSALPRMVPPQSPERGPRGPFAFPGNSTEQGERFLDPLVGACATTPCILVRKRGFPNREASHLDVLSPNRRSAL